MRLCHSTLFVLIAAAAAAASAGTVDVRFANTGSYTDAGVTTWEAEANLQTIARHLQAIGQRWLPANQVLKVVVLDVDLAGTVRPFRGVQEIRVLRGGADFPRMHLQYTLEVDGKTARTGDEGLTDLNYTRHLPGYRDSESLYYEKRMIDEWFKTRFGRSPASAG